MDVIICHCSWDIPGVERLPSHSHVYSGALEGTGRYWERGPFQGEEIMRLVPEPDMISLYVDWKEIAKALGANTT